MTKSRLKQLRLIIPGIIVMIYLVVFNQFTFEHLFSIPESLKSNSKFLYLIYFILALIVGTVYHILKIRHFLWDNYLPLIQQNIRSRLLDISGNELNSENLEVFKSWKNIKDVFYHHIDNDSSLQDKANSVRFNGLLWTTIMDAAIISFLVSMTLFLAGFWSNNIDAITNGYIVLAVCIICLFLIHPLTKSHIDESNKQLDYMELHLKEEITNKINEILQ